MKCDENYEKGGGYMFFGGQSHLVHDTKWEGVVGPLRFSKFPLSDHGVHTKIVQTPRLNTYYFILLQICKFRSAVKYSVLLHNAMFFTVDSGGKIPIILLSKVI